MSGIILFAAGFCSAWAIRGALDRVIFTIVNKVLASEIGEKKVAERLAATLRGGKDRSG